MVAIIIIIIVLIVAAIVVVQSVINKGVYRAKQTVLGGAGLDHQTICDKVISGPLHNKALAQMQADKPYATAELDESRFAGVVNAVMTGAPVAGVPSTMIDKIRNNGKFSHLKNGVYTKTGLINYRQGAVYAQAVFVEGTDQWILYIRGSFDQAGNLNVTQLQISKGIQGGF